MDWKTSEFIRLSGATPRLLRYYEDKGVIIPTRNADNAYHFYSEQDLIMLWEARSLYNVGVPVDQIHLCREPVGKDYVINVLTKLQKELDEEIITLERRLKSIASTKSRYERLEFSADNIVNYNYHGIYRVYVNDPISVNHPSFPSIIQSWTAALPQTKFTMSIDHTQLSGDPDHILNTRIGLGVSRRSALELHLPVDDPIELSERSSGGMCSISLRDPTIIRESNLAPLLEHAKANQKEIIGDFHARLAHVSMSDGSPIFHFFMHSVLG